MMKIGKYTLRIATERDRHLLETWIAGDPDHVDKTTADFFIAETSGNPDCYALEDESGLVVFYMKMTMAHRLGTLWLDMQFACDQSLEHRRWVSKALVTGFEWLKTAARGADMSTIAFESTKLPLILFCERRLGFQRDGSTVSYPVTPPPPEMNQENALQR